MKILLSGQRSFGRAVLKRLLDDGHAVVGVAVPPQDKYKDKMQGLALLRGIPVLADGESLSARNVPEGTDLIVSAHSHWMISGKALTAAAYGGIGFHPSLLPRHRGRDAVRWTVHMKDAVTGGTVYRLEEGCDAGGLIAQRFIHVDPRWDHHDLWRELFPLGVRMLAEAVRGIDQSGRVNAVEQDERFATWEPSFDRPRLRRNDMLALPAGG